MSLNVQVLEQQNGYFPAKFRLKDGGPILVIDAVERCWTEMRDHLGGVNHRFQVRCGGKRYLLREDLASGHWTLVG